MTKSSTQSLIYIAIGAALIASLSQISLAIGPVPFTLQTLAVALIASLFKPKEALASVAVYLLLGAIGLPVFAGFSGGIQALVASPTSGFLWGFLLYAGLTASLTKPTSHPLHVILANIIGDAACFVLGILVFKLISQASWTDTITWTTLPFLLPECFKIATVTLAHKLIQPVLKSYPYFTN